jgi:HD-like signal output (HDOD) protein
MSSTPQALGFSFVEQLAQDLKDEHFELPAFPEAVLRIQRMLQSSETTTDQVVRALSSEAALAARLLRIANSAEFRRLDGEITDLRKAVSRMGFNMVRSVAVAFAMRQLRRKDLYPADVQAELERIWRQSLDIASLCFVLAKRFTRINPDQALLAGLLHVLGRLYIVMRAQTMRDRDEPVDVAAVVGDWHATIGNAILESWGIPETIRVAVAQQDEIATEFDGGVSLAEVLIVAKLLGGERDRSDLALLGCPALKRLAGGNVEEMLDGIESRAEEIAAVRATLDG